MIRSKSREFFIKLFKYIPFLGTLIFTLHTGLLVFNLALPGVEMLIDSSILGGALMLGSSELFNMCKIHRLGIWYVIVVSFCIDFLRLIGFGIILMPMRLIVFIIGILLILMMIIKYVREHSFKSPLKDS